MGSMTVGNRSISFVSVGNGTVIRIYYGKTLIYLYVGYQLLDADENVLLDADGNNLMCI